MAKTYLFSIDLEDVRENVKNGHLYKDRVQENTLVFLEWLAKKKAKCTFFVVGKMAQKYPDLIKEIVSQNHEVAAHGMHHISLDKLNKDSFQKDIQENKEALLKAGAKDCVGFRAPIFSLTKEKSWVYETLADAGFEYSSSVLPARNPLFGWADFGQEARKVNGVWELPMSVGKVLHRAFPVAGGIYFRVIPWLFLKPKIQDSNTVLGYFHPYDIDYQQERFMHSGINESKFYNELMYYGRKNLISKMDKILRLGFSIEKYDSYVERIST